MDPTQQTVLVTGCSSGIGRATVELLAERGWRVFAGVRHQADGEQFASLKGVKPLVVDVTCDAQAAEAAARVAELVPQGLAGLVNNAGVGAPAAVELTDLEEFRTLLEVNAVGALRMTQLLLPSLRSAAGRIVNMSSMNGTIALPMVGAYSASKFALEALSDTMRVELRPWGVTVSLIRPGQVRTAIFDKARDAIESRAEEIPVGLRPGYAKMYATAARFNERGARGAGKPEQVARAVHKALTARWPRARYVVGWDAWALQVAQWLVPQRLIDRALARTTGSLHRVDPPSSNGARRI